MRLSLSWKEKIRYESLLLLLSSSIYILSQPPFDLFFLAYFFLVPLIFVISEKKPRESFSYGLVWGFLTFLGLIYWVVIAMNRYGKIDLLSSILCLLILCAYLGLYPASSFFLSVLFDKSFRIPKIFSFPFLWVFLEYMRSVLLSGFPWALLVYSQYNFLPLIQICSYTGPYFISFLLISMNCAIFYLLKGERNRFGLILISVIFLTFSLLILYGKSRLNENLSPGRRLVVQLVQPSIPQDIKWDEIQKIRAFYTHASMVKDEKRYVDLIIWPETSLPYPIEEKREILEAISSLSRLKNAAILLGAISRDEKQRIYNSAFLFERNGNLSGIYRKVKLVPFGEYTPLADYFPFLERISVAAGSFSPGLSHKPLTLESNLKIGILICYEGIFPEISRQKIREGSEILVNITNDAWYERSSAPYQHFSFYVLRAVENGRYVVRCANTGISGIIDPMGRIIERTELYEVKSIFGEVYAFSGQTFYSRYGEWFLLTLLSVYASILLIFYFRKKSSGRMRESLGK